MSTTHTYALLPVSKRAYDEIAAKLRDVGYGFAINEAGEIDMHGLALEVDNSVCADSASRDEG